MPLTTLAKIKPFLSITAHQLLNKEDSDFEKIEIAASEIIVAHSNIIIPDDTENAPDWITFPIAHIIEYLISAQIELSIDAQNIILKKYNNAIQLCRENAQSISTKNGQFSYNDFTKVYK